MRGSKEGLPLEEAGQALRRHGRAHRLPGLLPELRPHDRKVRAGGRPCALRRRAMHQPGRVYLDFRSLPEAVRNLRKASRSLPEGFRTVPKPWRRILEGFRVPRKRCRNFLRRPEVFRKTSGRFRSPGEEFWRASESPGSLPETFRGVQKFSAGLQNRPEGLQNCPEALENRPEALQNRPEALENFLEGSRILPKRLQNRPEGLQNRSEALENRPEPRGGIAKNWVAPIGRPCRMASGVRSSWATSAISCRRRRSCSANAPATRPTTIRKAVASATSSTRQCCQGMIKRSLQNLDR